MQRVIYRVMVTAILITLSAWRMAVSQQSKTTAYKGIMQSVSYSEDVELNGVYFVTVDEGWVSGGNGISAGWAIFDRSGRGNCGSTGTPCGNMSSDQVICPSGRPNGSVFGRTSGFVQSGNQASVQRGRCQAPRSRIVE